MDTTLESFGRVIWINKYQVAGLVYKWGERQWWRDVKLIRNYILIPTLLLFYTGKVADVLYPYNVNSLLARRRAYIARKILLLRSATLKPEQQRCKAYQTLLHKAPLNDWDKCHLFLTQELIRVAHSNDWADHIYGAVCQDLIDNLPHPPSIAKITTPPSHIPQNFKPEFLDNKERIVDVIRPPNDYLYNVTACQYAQECSILKEGACAKRGCFYSNVYKIFVKKGSGTAINMAHSAIAILRKQAVTPVRSLPQSRGTITYRDITVAHDNLTSISNIERSLSHSNKPVVMWLDRKRNSKKWLLLAYTKDIHSVCRGTWVHLQTSQSRYIFVKNPESLQGFIYNPVAKKYISPTGKCPSPLTYIQALFYTDIMNYYGRVLTEKEVEQLSPYCQYSCLVLLALQLGGLHLMKNPVTISFKHCGYWYRNRRKLDDMVKRLSDRIVWEGGHKGQYSPGSLVVSLSEMFHILPLLDRESVKINMEFLHKQVPQQCVEQLQNIATMM